MRGKEKVVEVSTGSPFIAGRYERFNTKLGQGAFKTVYKAFDTLEQIDVAWNCIDLSCINCNLEREKIFKECDILRKLNHPNILRIGDKWYNETEGHLNFITNLVHDGSLSKYFKNRSINLIRIKKIAQQILSALAYLHANGIIHRDLKGDNIFIEGHTGNVVIGDMGLSCNAVSARSIVGTPHFMAPELFKEKYNEMVDIWSFGMVILELVTQQMPYIECKGAFQAYQAIVSGTKPLILSLIANNYIRYFIAICINVNPKLRPSAVELLNHPFLLKRTTDRILCHKCLKSKKKKYPEPPDTSKPPSLFVGVGGSKKQPSTPVKSATLKRSISKSQEKVAVEKVDVNGNIYKITMQIYSNSFSDKVVTVEFDYDKSNDKPQAVADEMVKALKLDNHFLHKIQSAIIVAIQTNAMQVIDDEDVDIDIKDDEPEKKSDKVQSNNSSMIASDPSSLFRVASRENIKLKEKQDTKVWLTENGLSELIPIFNKESLTLEHLRDVCDDVIKELCDQYGWTIVIRLKLQKAVKDIKPVAMQTPQDNYFKLEQTQLFDELARKHQVVSRDINQIKDALNELERTAQQCTQAVEQNCDQMLALVEQDRDKLLQQIQSLVDTRKESLQHTLNILSNINSSMLNTQTLCGQIANKHELQAIMRLQQIKQIISSCWEEEKNKNTFNNTLIDRSNYKLKLNLNLEGVIDSIEHSMKLEFCETEFELIYNNVVANVSSSSLLDSPPVQSTHTHTQTAAVLMPIQSNTHLMNSTEIKANVLTNTELNQKLVIDDIKLDFNTNDFMQIKQNKNKNNLIFQHNINPTSPFNKRTQSVHSGLIQSDYSHIHMSPLQARKTITMQEIDNHMFMRSAPLINMGMKKRKTQKHLMICPRDELLVDGYIRKYGKYDRMLAQNICMKIWQFYHFDFELLKFSKIYKSTDGWRFYDGQTCIKRLKVAVSATEDDEEVYENYKWILSEKTRITNCDIICWRIWIRNPNKGLIVIGICRKTMFKSNKQHQTMVYGIGCAENKWYPINNKHIECNKINLNNFNQRECQIDMKVNTMNATLHFYILQSNENINMKNNELEAKITGLPTNNSYHEWLPYFNSYQNSVGCQLKIAICPISWYGKYRNDIF